MKPIKMLSWGILAACGALIIELAISILFPSISSSALQSKVTLALVTVVLVEEFFKFILIKKSSEKSSQIFFDALLIGVGFAIVEIILNSSILPDFWLAYIPQYLGLFLVHCATTLIYGYSFARIGKLNFAFILVIFLAGSALHFLYNLSVIYILNYLIVNGILLIIIIIIFGLYFRQKQASLPNK